MDETAQPASGYPHSGPPIAGAPDASEQPTQAPPPYGPPLGQPVYGSAPYGPPPYGPPPGYPPYQPPQPPASRGRGWIVALGIIGVFFIGAIVVCAWFGSLISDSEPMLAGDAIALIRIDGVISGTSGGVSSDSVTPESVLDQLQQAEDDNRVRVIILRVDSPGGTAAASEEIATEVARVKKPVVVSIGDVGASGAYMVSSQADWIISAPGSNVGSIGVILQVANLEGLLDKLGVDFAVITAGKYKDVGSPYRSLTPTETQLLQEQVDIIYEQFIDFVAKGRKMPKDKVRELATGFAWAGTEAKDLGLVDQIGTYNDAVHKAASLGKISGKPQIIEYGGGTYIDLLDMILGVSAKLDTIATALKPGTASTSPPLAR